MSFHTSVARKATALIIAIAALLGIASANAQSVFLTFSGGGGTAPVTVSWSSPITYTLTFTSPNSGVNPYFVFQGLTNGATAFPVNGPVTGTLPTYSSTGVGSTDGVKTIGNMFAATTSAQNAVAANDLVFLNYSDTAPTILTAGDVITLSAGSMVYTGVSAAPYSGVLPANGLYNTFIVDAAYVNLSASAIPEPATAAALAGLAALGFVAWRRRSRAQAGA